VDTQTDCAREQHHVMLHNKIQRVNEVIDRLNGLHGKIVGSPPPISPMAMAAHPAMNDAVIKMPEDMPPPAPSLSMVLEEGSSELNEKINHCMDLISDIENRLF